MTAYRPDSLNISSLHVGSLSGEINGLPAHILLVHLAVVGVPLAALLTVLSGVWPAARRRLGLLTPIAAFGAVVVVIITMRAGEWLRARVTPSPLIAHHAELGDQLLPWAVGLFVIALGEWLWFRRADAPSSTGARRVIGTVIVVLATVVAAGAVVQIYRIGESGSKAVWTGSFSTKPLK